MIKAVSNFKQNGSSYNSVKVPNFNMNNLAKQPQSHQIAFTGLNGSKVGKSLLGDFAHSTLGRIRRLANEVSHSTREFFKSLKSQDELPLGTRPLTANGEMTHPDPLGVTTTKIKIKDKDIPQELDGKFDSQGNHYQRTGDGTVNELDNLADDGISDASIGNLTNDNSLAKVESSLDLDANDLGRIGADDLSSDKLVAELDAGAPELDINLDSHLAELGIDSHELGIGEHGGALDAPRPGVDLPDTDVPDLDIDLG